MRKLLHENWSDALDVPCRDITAESVARFAARIDGFSASQFNHLVNLVRVLVPAAKFLRRRLENPKIANLPAEDRFRALLNELDAGRSKYAGLVARLLAFTGLRIGEAYALRKEDIRPNGILVRDSKSGRPRMIPFIGDCQKVVAELASLSDGPRLVPVKSIRRALQGAAKRAGVSPLTHHDFRRLFATRVIEAGVDILTAARWLGHKDGGALLGRTYFHLLDEHSLAMADRVKFAA